MIRPGLAAAALLALAACTPQATRPGDVHYVIGKGYETGGVWRYPAERFDYVDTGIATVATRGAGRTADGEVFDQGVLAAAHPTLQLPAVARITNLENGRSVVVRINDRGPADPARLVAVTRRTAQLLAAADPRGFRVKVQVLADESRQLAANLQAGHVALLKVATSATGAVQSEALAPPPGAASMRGRSAASGPTVRVRSAAPLVPVPLRMPEIVNQTMPHPGVLAVDLADFGELGAARVMAGRFARLAPRVSTSYYAPRDAAYRVRTGPYTTLAEAEAALRRALAAGAAGARIVVE